MRQVLFTIPIPEWLQSIQLHFLDDPIKAIPIYGYGLMLFLAYLLCTTLGKRLCKREGIDSKFIPDLAIWLFIAGIIGSRVVYVAEYWQSFRITDHHPLWDGVRGLLLTLIGIGVLIFAYQRFYQRKLWVPALALGIAVLFGFRIVFNWYWRPFFGSPYAKIFMVWDGGLVFYGGVIGGVIGYFACHYFVLRKLNISTWKMLDVAAPCICLGAALGRIGCLCTGCCYGNVACESCPVVHFPGGSPAALDMIRRGYQTPQGFLLAGRSREVGMVEPGSDAAGAGLRAGDVILEVNGDPAANPSEAVGPLELTVLRAGERITLEPFVPHSLGVHPTQLYDTIGMLLLMFFLLSYFPYRRRHGELMVFLMFGYGVHRFLSEALRLDNDPGWFGMTLSQDISVLVLAAGGGAGDRRVQLRATATPYVDRG